MNFSVTCPYCDNKVVVFPDAKSGIIRSATLCQVEKGGCDSWFFVMGEVQLVAEARKIEGEGHRP